MALSNPVNRSRLLWFVWRAFPCNNNPQAYIVAALTGQPPAAGGSSAGSSAVVTDAQSERFYASFVEPCSADKQLWDQVFASPPPTAGTATGGFFSRLLGREQPQEPQRPALLYQPVETPQATAPPGPAPDGFAEHPPSADSCSDRYIQAARDMMPRTVPGPASMSTLVLVRPEWDSDLRSMRIVDQKRLPGPMVVDRDSLRALQEECDQFSFPDNSNPMPAGQFIDSSQVKFVVVHEAPKGIDAIRRWIAQQPMSRQTEVTNPQWVIQSISEARKKRAARKKQGAPDIHPAAISSTASRTGRHTGGVAVRITRTGSKAGTSEARAERHHRAADNLRELMRQHKTVY